MSEAEKILKPLYSNPSYWCPICEVLFVTEKRVYECPRCHSTNGKSYGGRKL
jgi:Zn finger protein HypA/HybF involved in hydrogenase expression